MSSVQPPFLLFLFSLSFVSAFLSLIVRLRLEFSGFKLMRVFDRIFSIVLFYFCESGFC